MISCLASSETAFAISNVHRWDFFHKNFAANHLVKRKPNQIDSIFQGNHKTCHSWVCYWKPPMSFNEIRYGIIDPRDPMTLPYQTEKTVDSMPFFGFDATNSLSEANF